MKKHWIQPAFLILLSALFVACGSTSHSDPLMELNKLKEQKAAIDAQISALEKDLEAQGLIEKRLRTVAITELQPSSFAHFIDLQGKVEADESVAATSRIPGTLQKVYVRNGDVVQRGQLLATIDDAVMLKGIAELEGQLAVATDLFDRQKALWDQGIGSEVQFIQAKNGKESIERSIATLRENWEMTKIYAPTSGTVDLVLLKQGQAISPGIPLCNIVNMTNLKVTGAVTEAYVAKIKRGDEVKIYFPDLNKEISSKISFVSKSINPTNRTFIVECNLGQGDYRANQIAVLKIIDYHNPEALTIPINLVQAGEGGDFIFVAENTDDAGKAVVRKRPVTLGQNYNGYVEVLTGLRPGEKLISSGFQDVHEGEIVMM
jgi:membrane fusion protein (multidrug efflux system)